VVSDGRSVAICDDFRFPEVCRALALRGGEMIAAPVNWSTSVSVVAELVVPARAIENRVYVAVAGRTGVVGETDVFAHRRPELYGAVTEPCPPNTEKEPDDA
jgi:predicted amidohydrolase